MIIKTFNLPVVELYQEVGLKLGVMRKPDLFSLRTSKQTKSWGQQGCHTADSMSAIHVEQNLNNVPDKL